LGRLTTDEKVKDNDTKVSCLNIFSITPLLFGGKLFSRLLPKTSFEGFKKENPVGWMNAGLS
jgi:hypothetical protein